MYGEWVEVVEQLTDSETGKNIQYKGAKRELDKLNLTKDQIDSLLEIPLKSTRRGEGIKSSRPDLPTGRN